MPHYRVLITGTDPKSGKGGIAVALHGYMAAMDSLDIPYDFLPTHSASARNGRWLWLLKALPVIWKVVRGARREGERVIVYSHAGAGLSLLRQYIVMMFGRLLGAKAVLHLHAFEVDSYLDSKIKKLLLKIVFSSANAVCVLTDWWVNRLASAGIEEKIFSIPNPLTPFLEKKTRSQSEGEKPGKELVVLALTRLVKGKGIGLIIEAMPYVSDNVRLVIAGSGECMGKYKKRVGELDLFDRVRFSGWVAGEDKHLLFNEANLFCLPTTYDAFGLVFIEAMAYGLPVVALDWGPISDVVPTDKVGILIREKDPKKLAEAIELFLSQEFQRKMSIQAKNWVLEQYSIERVSRLIHLMFEEILANQQ